MDENEQTSNPDPTEDSEGQPASILDGEEHPVDPRSVRVARLVGVPITLLIACVPLAFITVGWALGGIPNRVYFPLFAGFFILLTMPVLLAYKWPAARHRRLRYKVDEGGVRIRRGVFWRKVIWIPITRVQHTDVSQGPLQRRYELATLTVHTAGTAGASIALAGLEHGVATRLCDHLRPDNANNAD